MAISRNSHIVGPLKNFSRQISGTNVHMHANGDIPNPISRNSHIVGPLKNFSRQISGTNVHMHANGDIWVIRQIREMTTLTTRTVMELAAAREGMTGPLMRVAMMIMMTMTKAAMTEPAMTEPVTMSMPVTEPVTTSVPVRIFLLWVRNLTMASNMCDICGKLEDDGSLGQGRNGEVVLVAIQWIVVLCVWTELYCSN
jgi:hypothetical protein